MVRLRLRHPDYLCVHTHLVQNGTIQTRFGSMGMPCWKGALYLAGEARACLCIPRIFCQKALPSASE